MRKKLSLLMSLAIIMSALMACSGGQPTSTKPTTAASGSVTTQAVTAATTTAPSSKETASTAPSSLSTTAQESTVAGSQSASSSEIMGITIPSMDMDLTEGLKTPYYKWLYGFILDEGMAQEALRNSISAVSDPQYTDRLLELARFDYEMIDGGIPMEKAVTFEQNKENFKLFERDLQKLDYDGSTALTEYKEKDGTLVTVKLNFDETTGSVEFSHTRNGELSYWQSVVFKDKKFAKTAYKSDGSLALEFVYDEATQSGKFSLGESKVAPPSLFKNAAAAQAADFGTKYSIKYKLSNGEVQE